jgi:hypothetical protein
MDITDNLHNYLLTTFFLQQLEPNDFHLFYSC